MTSSPAARNGRRFWLGALVIVAVLAIALWRTIHCQGYASGDLIAGGALMMMAALLVLDRDTLREARPFVPWARPADPHRED